MLRRGMIVYDTEFASTSDVKNVIPRFLLPQTKEKP